MTNLDEKSQEIIAVHDLYKSYGNNQVLKGLNLSVQEGETVVILGRSGVGKSVLLKQILGLEKPDSGYIEINGKRIDQLTSEERFAIRKPMGMLFQGAALFDSMTIGQNTAFYLRQHEPNLSDDEIQERVSNSLELVGLEDTEKKMPSDLSGGMRKRAGFARLIIYKPKIILYDEPTTGLDPITAMQISQLINTIQERLKATSIVVTHDIRSALEVADRLAFHNDGKIEVIASPSEFLTLQNPHVKAFFDNAILKEQTLREVMEK
ncbi:putative ABC transporter ATP-binding protein [Candidatus Rubidus massiliensis]|nr:putative ABC transporter ATP-binding protein [Candidatus Rubidus massiliensis]